MKKVIGYGFLSQFVASIVLLPIVVWKEPAVIYFVLASLLVSGKVVFHKTLNLLQCVGPVYWVSRDFVPENTPLVCLGFMKEIQEPWRIGKGIQIKGFGRTFQIGLCRRQHYQNSLDGELSVIGARFMDTVPEEIGEW